MLTTIATIALALLLLVALILVIASRRPDTFRTERTIRIAAPAERIFPLIDDLRAMNTWNPFALRETGGTSNYRGPARGPGAAFDFAGPKSGTGDIEIVDTTAPTRVALRLRMTKPIAADNAVEFTLRSADGATDVTWAMSGRQPLLAKCMTLFVDCDRMVGREFEQGLANLKAIAERG